MAHSQQNKVETTVPDRPQADGTQPTYTAVSGVCQTEQKVLKCLVDTECTMTVSINSSFQLVGSERVVGKSILQKVNTK